MTNELAYDMICTQTGITCSLVYHTYIHTYIYMYIHTYMSYVHTYTHTYRGYLLLDPARIIIFIASLVLITHASQRAVILDKDSKEDSTLEGMTS